MDTGKALAVAGLAGAVLWFLDQKLTAPATVVSSTSTGTGNQAANAVDAAANKASDVATSVAAGVGNAFHIPGASTLAKFNPVTVGVGIGRKLTPVTTPVIHAVTGGVKTAVTSVAHGAASVVHSITSFL